MLEVYGSTPLISGIKLSELIRRPELNYQCLAPIDSGRKSLPYDVAEQVNINIKYDGYIKRQQRQVEQFSDRGKTEAEGNPTCIHWTGIQNIRSFAGGCFCIVGLSAGKL